SSCLHCHGNPPTTPRSCEMADSKRKRGKSDRTRVAGKQRAEVSYVARKYGVSADTVRKVIKRVGNNRTKVYAALEKIVCCWIDGRRSAKCRCVQPFAGH